MSLKDEMQKYGMPTTESIMNHYIGIRTTPSLRQSYQQKRAKTSKFYPCYFFDLLELKMKSPDQLSFTSVHKKEPSVAVSTKLVHAAFKRSNRITDRIMKLTWKQSEIKRRLIIFQHTQTQKRIQMRADMQFKQSLATMRRQSYIWRIVEQSAMKVEKAVTICNLRKLQKAQADRRLSSKNMAKKMMDNTQMLYANCDRSRAPFPIDTKHLMPPITRFSLRELDVTEIYGNYQLRHDLVFDSDMQFRPNNDGDKGTVKALKACQYWNEIEAEILAVNEKSGQFLRMPVLLTEIREILIEMFNDTKEVKEELKEININVIIKGLEEDMDNGIPYMVLIAKIMHIYCAPCRDELIDDMVALYQSRFHVDALTKCLDILEHMRLDFANHNLRKLRPLLVDKSSQCEWREFTNQMKLYNACQSTVNWIDSSFTAFKETTITSNNFYEFAFMRIITNSHMSETSINLPETLRYDKNRISSFHNDWQDISIMNTLLILFKQFSGTRAISKDVQRVKKLLWLILNDPETSMENVTAQLVKEISTVTMKKMDTKNICLLNRLVDSTLSIDSSIYIVVQKKVADALLHYLIHGQFDKTILKSTLLHELESETTELAMKIKQLVSYNQKTYQEVYKLLIKKLE